MTWIRKTFGNIDISKILNNVIYQNNTDKALGIVSLPGSKVTLVDADGIEITSLGGGGASAGGNDSWTTQSGAITATPTVGAKTITFAGLPFTLTAGMIAGGEIKKIDSSGNVETLDISSVTVSGLVATLTNIDDFVSGDTVEVSLKAIEKAYDLNQDGQKNITQNPDEDSYHALESAAFAGIDDRVYQTLMVGDGFRKLDISYYIESDANNYGLKIFATWDSAATFPADGADPSTAWHDVTTAIFGGAITGSAGSSNNAKTFQGMPHAVIAQVTLDNADGSASLNWRKYNF